MFAGLLVARAPAASAEAVVFAAAVVATPLEASAVVVAFVVRRVEALVPRRWLVGFASVAAVAAVSDVAEFVVAEAVAAPLFVPAAFVVGVAAFPAAVARAASSADSVLAIGVDFASAIAAAAAGVEGRL